MQAPALPALEPTCACFRAAPAAPARLGLASIGDCFGASLQTKQDSLPHTEFGKGLQTKGTGVTCMREACTSGHCCVQLATSDTLRETLGCHGSGRAILQLCVPSEAAAQPSLRL